MVKKFSVRWKKIKCVYRKKKNKNKIKEKSNIVINVKML